MDGQREARSFEFAVFRVDTAQRRLFGPGGKPIELPSRAFDLLVYMVEHPGDLLDKSRLLKAIWPNTVVEEGNLTQCVFALRKALGDDVSEHRFVVTVPGRGYQFVAPVTQPQSAIAEAEAGSSPAVEKSGHRRLWLVSGFIALLLVPVGFFFWSRIAPQSVRTPLADSATPAIAVLPFADLSPGNDMEYFADGLAEELINSLARAGNLRVIGRRSAFAFKGRDDDARTVGEKLKVGTILEGSVRKDGDRIRITTQLTRTSDGLTLWTQTYDRKLDDVLDVQDSIAREVASALEPSVIPERGTNRLQLEASRTRNPEAYNAYLRGVFFYQQRTTGGYLQARDEFMRAVELDPDFAIAHAWLARSYSTMRGEGIGDVAKAKTLALAALDRALKLEPRIADIWWVNSQFFQGANAPLSLRARAVERALAVEPGDTDAMVRLGDIYFHQGRRDEAFSFLHRAYVTDPLWDHAAVFLAYTSYMFRSDRELALKLAAEVSKRSPNNPRIRAIESIVAKNEGRPLEWDRKTAEAVAAAPRDQMMQFYVASDYADLRIWDAALYHAKLAREVAPDSAAGWQSAAHILLLSGDVEGARKYVQEVTAVKPGDYQAILAQSELQYFTGDCHGALRSLIAAQPTLDQPGPALRLMVEIDLVPILVWCQRQTGNTQRAMELVEVFNRLLAPPVCPGLMDGIQARVAAAIGDRKSLIAHLNQLLESRAIQVGFAPHEPMIQPFLNDPVVAALLAKLDARGAEWRKVIPKSSMKVPIPAAPTSTSS